MCNDSKDAFRKPAELLKFAGLSESDRVLDVSCGFGYLAKHIAGTTNQVVDVQNGSEFRELFESFGIQKVIDSLERDYKMHHFWSSFENPSDSASNEYDLITIQNSFHDLYDMSVDRNKFFASIKTALKPEGRFLIVDHRAAPKSGSSDTKNLHRIEEALVREELAESGFIVDKESDMFSFPEDDYKASAWKEPNVNTDRFVLLCKVDTSKDDKEQKTAKEKDEVGATHEPPSKKAKQT